MKKQINIALLTGSTVLSLIYLLMASKVLSESIQYFASDQSWKAYFPAVSAVIFSILFISGLTALVYQLGNRKILNEEKDKGLII